MFESSVLVGDLVCIMIFRHKQQGFSVWLSVCREPKLLKKYLSCMGNQNQFGTDCAQEWVVEKRGI